MSSTFVNDLLDENLTLKIWLCTMVIVVTSCKIIYFFNTLDQDDTQSLIGILLFYINLVFGPLGR